MFPRTKFVHLIRDGRACAWSMSQHFAFRFMVAMNIPIANSSPDRAPDADNDGDSERQQASSPIDFSRIMSQLIPVANFGRFWSQLIITGVQTLMVLPEEQILTIRYEDIIADPRRSPVRLMGYIDPTLNNADWLERACALVERRPSGWVRLPAEEIAALEKACEPGQAIVDVVLQEGMHSSRLAALLHELAKR
jgi:hypothetical protein